jgi:glycyl-tRNA synthetase beta chain
MPDLLIELFSEEIPARMQGKAAADLKKLVTDGLVTAGLTYASAGAFSTPRRLVLSVDDLTATSKPVREERKGPRVDAPQAAIDGFLRSTGQLLEQLVIREEKKAEVYYAIIEKPGRTAGVIVAEVLETAIRSFPWPKSMRWGNGTLRWVRPLHSILCLLTTEAGADVVPLTVDGITAGNTTEGHRFMAPGRFAVSSFDDYTTKLKRAKVILNPAEREAHIWQDATNAAFAAGMEIVPDAALLTEVAGLVEWPVVLMGRIDDAFLSLPPEVLQTSMKEHQKFFSVRNPKTARIEGFVTVSNVETKDHGATILKGNQKVLTARLSDAKFFWENDLRTVKTVGLEGMGAGLSSVTFHNKLGSQADRIARIESLAREIAPLVGAQPDLAAEAARVAKADLQSAMVGEFPELQGLMGMYYARAAGLPDAVALAARDHYSPLGPSDAVPTDPVTVAVALADKIDTLTGFWAFGLVPTGSKDPFALRRSTLGGTALITANNLRIELSEILFRQIFNHRMSNLYENGTLSEGELYFLEEWADRVLGNGYERAQKIADVLLDEFRSKEPPIEVSDSTDVKEVVGAVILDCSDLLAFFHDRLKVFLKDQGIRHDVIDACLAMPGNDDLTLLVKRAGALAAFLKTDDGTNLLQGYKRANNILSQAEAKDGVEYSFGADLKFAETDEERALFAALDAAEQQIAPAMQAEDFAAAMSAMAGLRAPIDAFFNAVQVNSDNQIVRRNRLNLLHRIRTICSGVADLTKVEA